MSLLFLHVWLCAVNRVSHQVASRADERGQTTAEYALVIIGVAAIASLVLAWATRSHAVANLFDSVINKITPG
ncbi:MAG: hypothetical protein JWL83_3449 [Actinomycetia bacterium]|nr:hypothetical protein [Actinomycetes bacterium]